MKILLTGATGYIGKRLLPYLLAQGHEVICCCRDTRRLTLNDKKSSTFEIDFLDENANNLPKDIDVAYYLIHSMSSSYKNFMDLEAKSASIFSELLTHTNCKQIIFLSGIYHEGKLSKHLLSRQNVEKILRASTIPVTTLQAGIIVGSGSSSFEIIRDLTEKLPFMVAPKWIHTKCQPIAIRNVIECLSKVILHKECMNKSFEIGGKDVLSYKEMLLTYAKVRKLKRYILTVPVLTPTLSSLWLYFVTATNFKLARSLVESMTIDVQCKENKLLDILDIESISYENAIQRAFQKIEQNMVISSWKDSYTSSQFNKKIYNSYIHIPEYGCFKDYKSLSIKNDVAQVCKNIWSIGGKRGWYYATFLWKLRGYIDKLVGGVGLRRGRTNLNSIHTGDALDFWRVIYANKEEHRLMLYAEMKLPGEAWLEFSIVEKKGEKTIRQVATFRPSGILGRLYWFLLLPFHSFIFSGMIKRIERHTD